MQARFFVNMLFSPGFACDAILRFRNHLQGASDQNVPREPPRRPSTPSFGREITLRDLNTKIIRIFHLVAARRGGNFPSEINALQRPTRDVRAIGNIQEFRALSNDSIAPPGPANENPGALAGATGAVSNDLTTELHNKRKTRPSAIRDFASDRHKRATRMIGFGLIADSPHVWADVADVLAIRLTDLERAALAFAALVSLDSPSRQLTFRAAEWGVADDRP